MKIKLVILIVAQFLFNTYCLAAEYKLGPGDKISVTVYNESDLSISNVKIPKDGVISFPLLGEIKVSGNSLSSLKSNITKLLKDGYLKKPQIVISINEYRPFFINGQVKQPGGYPYVESLTVRKAIAIAGGLTDRASVAKIGLVPEGKVRSRTLRNGLDKPVNPGDIITIGESLF